MKCCSAPLFLFFVFFFRVLVRHVRVAVAVVVVGLEGPVDRGVRVSWVVDEPQLGYHAAGLLVPGAVGGVPHVGPAVGAADEIAAHPDLQDDVLRPGVPHEGLAGVVEDVFEASPWGHGKPPDEGLQVGLSGRVLGVSTEQGDESDA